MENEEETIKYYKVKIGLNFELERNIYDFVSRLAKLLDKSTEDFLIEELKNHIESIPDSLENFVNEETIREIYKLEEE